MLRKINKATSKQLTNSNTRRQTLKRNTTRMHATMKMYNPKSSGSTQDLHFLIAYLFSDLYNFFFFNSVVNYLQYLGIRKEINVIRLFFFKICRKWRKKGMNDEI